VAVLGLGVDGGYYVVLEYVDGGDLARHVGGGLPEPLALHVVHELALGLAHLHDARDPRGLALHIVHRDVSPANVLVSTTGDVKLGDFGIAKATSLADRTAAGVRKGRFAYMAPEQLAGEPVTAAADQFGLGATLVELVTGRRPFAGETPWALLDAIRGGPELGGLADDLRAIAARALAGAAADRFGSVEELRRAIAVAQRARPRRADRARGAGPGGDVARPLVAAGRHSTRTSTCPARSISCASTASASWRALDRRGSLAASPRRARVLAGAHREALRGHDVRDRGDDSAVARGGVAGHERPSTLHAGSCRRSDTRRRVSCTCCG
jgi:serine/threonine protein kinase